MVKVIMMNGILVLISGSNILKNSVYLELKLWSSNLPAGWTPEGHQLPTRHMPQHIRKYPEVCVPLKILKTFLTQEEIVLAHTGMCCLWLPRNRKDTQYSSHFLLKGFLYTVNKPPNKIQDKD